MLTVVMKDKIWGDRPWTDIVKMVGYDGMYVDDFKERAVPLAAEFADKKETFWACADKLLRIDYKPKPHKYRLRDEVRAIAWVILGPDPDNPTHQDWHAWKFSGSATPTKAPLPNPLPAALPEPTVPAPTAKKPKLGKVRPQKKPPR